MGVRETLNKQPAITTGATIGIILIALIFIIVQVSGQKHVKIPTKSYFTVDDGASYYTDDISLIPPYDHDGKQAVRADVYQCPSGGKFVAYLERYTADTKKVIEASRASGGDDFGRSAEAMARGLEVKAPLTGDQGWVSTTLPAASKIIGVTCPDGSNMAVPVMP